MEEISTSIWQLTEEVLELFRSQSTTEVRTQKRPELLWLDDLTETQGNTVIAVRQLCDRSPEGVTLKTLAETLGVTPAAASVMVDLLVKKKMLRRTRSKHDRRSILIRLTPDTSGLFDISERSLRRSVVDLADSLGPEMLREWHNILVAASAVLRETVGGRISAVSEPSGSWPGGDDESPSKAGDGAEPRAERTAGRAS